MNTVCVCIYYSYLHVKSGAVCPQAVCISGGPKKVAQLLVGHNFKTSRNISTKLHTTFFQHVFNHIQSKWTTNVEMTVVL